MKLKEPISQPTKTARRIHFDEIFTNQSGRVVPKVNMRFNGVVMGPNVCFDQSYHSNVDLRNFVGKYFDVEIYEGIYVVKPAYSSIQ